MKSKSKKKNKKKKDKSICTSCVGCWFKKNMSKDKVNCTEYKQKIELEK